MNGYEKRTQQKKDLILDTATEMFLGNGIANTSVADIAHKARVSKVTIFNYFESKENLVRAAMNRYFNNYLDGALKTLCSEEPFTKKIEILFSMGTDNYSLFRTDVFSSEIWKDPLMQQIYVELTAKAMPYIINFFEQGKSEGVIDPTIPIEALLAFLSASASLTNPGNREMSKEYIIGINKLFYFGLFGHNTSFSKTIKLPE